MQTHTQLPGKKADVLRVIMTIALLSASLPLVTACNPFAKAASVVTPACQSNNTASVAFQNTGTLYNKTFYVDGSYAVLVSPGSTSAHYDYTAGTHAVMAYFSTAGTVACSSANFTWSQCTSHTMSC